MQDYIISDKKEQSWIIGIVSLTVFMFSLDYSMLNISLPVIASFFKANLGAVSRLPLAYLLVVTSTALLFGKLGDIISFKKIFTWGLVVFVSGTLLCGFAPRLDLLLGLRVYQCIGEAMFSPIGIAIVTTFLPDNVKGRALGLMATAQGLGFCLGPVLGGFINDYLSWHGIFFVNIPFGILALIAAIKFIPSKQPEPDSRRVDMIGAVLVFICLSTLIYALNSISQLGLKDRSVQICFLVSLVSFAIFIMLERKLRFPILDLSLFRNRDFTFATASALCTIFVYMGLIFMLPFYLEMVRGIDIVRAGFLLMAPALMVIIFAPIAGIISDRLGSRWVCSSGLALTTLAFLIFSMMKPETPIWIFSIPLILAGIAIGFFLPGNNKLVMMHAPQDRQGMASAIYKILNSSGGALGIAVLPILIINTVRENAALQHVEMSAVKSSPGILILGFDSAFKFAMFVCIIGLVMAIFAKDKKRV